MAALTVGSLGDYIREQRETAQVSLRQLAKAAGVSNPYLSQVERGIRRPSAQILGQIAHGLRISAETLYVRAGILDPRPVGDVVAAVLADPSLGERQRRVLIDVYESLRAEPPADPGARRARPTSPDPTSAGAARRSPASAGRKTSTATKAATKTSTATKAAAKTSTATKAAATPRPGRLAGPPPASKTSTARRRSPS